jgi:hypothetical protein
VSKYCGVIETVGIRDDVHAGNDSKPILNLYTLGCLGSDSRIENVISKVQREVIGTSNLDVTVAPDPCGRALAYR